MATVYNIYLNYRDRDNYDAMRPVEEWTVYLTKELAQEELDRMIQRHAEYALEQEGHGLDYRISKWEKDKAEHNALWEAGLRDREWTAPRPKLTEIKNIKHPWSIEELELIIE